MGTSRLEELGLEGNPLGDKAGAALITALTPNTTLQYLRLQRTDIGPRTMQALLAFVSHVCVHAYMYVSR